MCLSRSCMSCLCCGLVNLLGIVTLSGFFVQIFNYGLRYTS